MGQGCPQEYLLQETKGTRSEDLPPVPSRRAVHISTVHPALDARIFYREALALRDHGYDVTVFGVCKEDARVEGVSVRAIGGSHGRFDRMAMSGYRGLRAVLAERGDVYHFHDPELMPAALLAKWLWRKRVVYDVHEDVALVMLKDWIPRWLRPVVARLLGRLDALNARCVDGLVVTTRRHYDHYKPLARRVTVFHNFPAPAFLWQRDRCWTPPEQRLNEVIHLGTVSQARLKVLVDIAQGFLEKFPEWQWTFLGMHPPMVQWFEANVQGPIRQRLHGLGKVPHEEVAAHLCRARIGVNYHRLDSRQLQMVIPLKVFEYMACGLGAISTRVPALVESLSDCGAVTFTEESPEQYLADLAALATRADLAAVGHEARRYADERLDCDREVQSLLALYDAILAGR